MPSIDIRRFIYLPGREEFFLPEEAAVLYLQKRKIK